MSVLQNNSVVRVVTVSIKDLSAMVNVIVWTTQMKETVLPRNRDMSPVPPIDLLAKTTDIASKMIGCAMVTMTVSIYFLNLQN